MSAAIALKERKEASSMSWLLCDDDRMNWDHIGIIVRDSEAFKRMKVF
ncbi:hypothetical protein V6243_00530 [Cobetia marina]|uniref:Uncharacterized protein n=1 Tax=Cobetia marina TaxID=28258 RepID=A0ABU9GB61_COBMA